MALRTPVLDDRSYAELRDELIARIPVFAPEWTDHHPSDPGITLIELFAFLGENLLFRFNQIPDATKVAFLDLLHIPRRPAVPSTGQVRFDVKGAGGDLVAPATRLLAGQVPFQTLDETTVWPVSARAAIRALADEALVPDTEEHVNRAAAALGASRAAVSTYRTSFGASDPTRPGGDVLDPVRAIDQNLYVAILGAAPGADLTAMAAGALSIGVVPAADVPSMEVRAQDPCPGQGVAPPSPPMQWQICTMTPVADAPDPTTADPAWRDVAVIGDTSAGLTAPGVVRLRLPADLSDIGVYEPSSPDAVGVGDQPPLVEDPEIRARLVAWLRVFRPLGGDLPALEWLDCNVSRVEQAQTARAEFLGVGTGEPGQTRALVHADVLGTIALEVEELGTGRWIPWLQVDDFRSSTVDDRHVLVDPEAGTVTCGDGRRGRVWQIGERIRVREYRFGGGAVGDVAPAAIAAAPDSPGIAVTNVLAPRGGADAESLADAVARIPDEMGRHDRAVTPSDFRQLAEATPGAGVGRAETLARFHPLAPREEAAGVVSVVVWPTCDLAHPNAPRPDRTMLDAVCRYLDERRLVTTELHVIPPTYRRIAVSARHLGQAGPRHRERPAVGGAGAAPVPRAVLPPYGPEGRGWPLGRRVFAPELEAAAVQVAGVEFLEPGAVAGSPCLLGLRLAEEQGEGNWAEPDGRVVTLEPWEVPELAAITVVEGPALEPGTGIEPVAPAGPAVPVRAPQEVC